MLTPVKIVARLAGKGIPIQAAAHYSAYDTYAMGARLKSRALGPLQRRFFVMKRHFSDKERAFFMDIDSRNHVALVALAEQAGRQIIRRRRSDFQSDEASRHLKSRLIQLDYDSPHTLAIA